MKPYLDDIGEYKNLTLEEENDLARQMRNAPTEQDRLEARDRLITANLRFVVSIAQEYAYKTHLSIDELISEGNLGLLQAVENYRPVGVKFLTYATYYVRRNMKIAMQKAIQSETISLDVKVKDNLPLHELIEDERDTETDKQQLQEQINHILSKLKRLSADERELIKRRFGIGCKRQTLREVGIRLGVSYEMVRLRETIIMNKLRGMINEEAV